MKQSSNTLNQVMWNRLLAVVEQQGQALIRAAFSPIVRECGDISAGIFDLRGRMMAQAVTGTPGHINTMAEAVKALPAAQREIVEMAFVRDMTQVEIAQELDVPLGTVKSRMRLAYGKLKGQLEAL